MQPTSNLYKSILAIENHWFECKVVINNVTYTQDKLYSVTTSNGLYSENEPQIGCCVSSELDIVMQTPSESIPKKAEIKLYVRVCEGNRQSEWIPKGTYYIDTREMSKSDNGVDILTIHGYDAMLKANNLYPSTSITYPALDTTVLGIITNEIGVTLDSRTVLNKGYMLSHPGTYTMREVLGYIASAYGGNFVINDLGKLQLVKFADIPTTTNYLIDSTGCSILFGLDRILV